MRRVVRRAAPYPARGTGSVALRCSSSRGPGQCDEDWDHYWGTAPQFPTQAKRGASPLQQDPGRKTASDWYWHHGLSGGKGDSVESPYLHEPDWEFSDGTPAPAHQRIFSRDLYRGNLMAQAVRAAARVEQLAHEGRLPRVPGSKEQRDWDPRIPLFLEDTDEHGPLPHSVTSAGGVEDPLHMQPLSLSSEGATAAPYNPEEFIHEAPGKPDPVRPFWNRRLWGLTNAYLISKPKRDQHYNPDK